MATTEPFKVDGIDYSRESVEAIRQDLIELRGAYVTKWNIGIVGLLSHTIAILAYLNELPRPEECTDCGD